MGHAKSIGPNFAFPTWNIPILNRAPACDSNHFLQQNVTIMFRPAGQPASPYRPSHAAFSLVLMCEQSAFTNALTKVASNAVLVVW
jgi:hypothetical protein